MEKFVWLEISPGLFEYGESYGDEHILNNVILKNIAGSVSVHYFYPFTNPEKTTCYYSAFGFSGVEQELSEAKKRVELIVEKYSKHMG